MLLRCVGLLLAAGLVALYAGDVAGQFKDNEVQIKDKVEAKPVPKGKAGKKAAVDASEAVKEVEPPATPVPPDLVEVRFTNGSVVVMTMLQDKIELVTDYGRLIVPQRDIRTIEFGIHPTDEEKLKLETALKQLGSNAHDEREMAVQELVALGPLAYQRLQGALKSTDLEVSRRAETTLKTIREKYPARLLRPREEDLVRTNKFSIVGRIVTPTLKAKADDFGDLDLRLPRLLAVRWMAGETKREVVVDAATYGAQGNSRWKATGIRLEPHVGVKITATGQVDLLAQPGNQRLVGPDGQGGGVMMRGRIMNNNGQQGGELMGRIGDSGAPFFIGSKHTLVPRTGGQLFLMIQQSPWGVNSTGEYRVTVMTGPLIEETEGDD